MQNKKAAELEDILNEVRRTYGDDSVEPYGDFDDPASLGFRVRGIPATFSLLMKDQLPARHFNIQIESSPPGDYCYYDPTVSFWEFLELVRLVAGPEANWPVMR